MRIRKLGACRGDGKAYIKVRIEGCGQGARFAIQGFTPDQLPVPVCLYPYGQKSGSERNGDQSLYVIELPLLTIPFLNLRIDYLAANGEVLESARMRVNYTALKWQSRFNYRARKALCAEIRDFEQGFILGQFQMGGLRYLESDNCIVWRFFIEWESAKDALPKVSALDGKGKPFPVEPILFEGQELPPTSTQNISRKRLCLSVKLDRNMNGFCLKADDELGACRSGFCCVDPVSFELYKYQTWKYMRDARADDANYRRWFALHRVAITELAAQRETKFEYEPKISVVVPCFKSTTIFLRDMVNSVLAQSYPHWELLLLDASPDSGVVKRAAQFADDSRIRYVDLGANEGIVANTNRGVREATGDFIAFLDHDDMIEPDTFFEYVKCINENPDVQLLYCDEDYFEESGLYGQPVFKTRLNLDLFYSHNCVTHFLMVRTSFLHTIGLSSDVVSGAQDYALTLRAIEAKGEILHVPRVLYHWRQHAASTSGDNVDSKPYAEEAGRLALEAHFKRRGVASDVSTTDHPFVYRVRYSLPTPHPQVSIIIPSRDHIEVLEPCIASIIEKSTYDNYRILIIENSSKEPETFAYYERIQKKCPRVSVITWEHEFNYSKIINFGVRQAESPYVLLLNNDTQVISPDFIEEMLGYLQRPEAGVVGAKLYFRDGLVQHAGMLIGPYGAVSHVNQNFSAAREGYLARAVRPGNFSSVTGACQMVKRSVFEAVGGYNEEFAVGFNDVDFCLKAWKAGFSVIFSPYAELFHYEFVSRGREVADPEKQRRWEQEQALFKQTWPECFENGKCDPFTNPNLDRDSFYYALPQV